MTSKDIQGKIDQLPGYVSTLQASIKGSTSTEAIVGAMNVAMVYTLCGAIYEMALQLALANEKAPARASAAEWPAGPGL